jgi:AraC-like DNA-binding protein
MHQNGDSLDTPRLDFEAWPLSDIAYACGFRDYAHFARKFRQRFSVVRQVPTSEDMVNSPATQQYAPGLVQMCHHVTRANRRRSKSFHNRLRVQ